MKIAVKWSLLALMCLLQLPVMAEEICKEQIKGLDEQVQDIKADVLAISTDLKLLEEKLLYPSNTQVSLFVALEGADSLRVDAVEVSVDGNPVAHHIYSFKELEALQHGGLQRIYTGNLRTGEHSLKVGFKGLTGLGNEFTEVASYTFSKGVGPGIVEIRLLGSALGSNSIQFSDR